MPKEGKIKTKKKAKKMTREGKKYIKKRQKEGKKKAKKNAKTRQKKRMPLQHDYELLFSNQFYPIL